MEPRIWPPCFSRCHRIHTVLHPNFSLMARTRMNCCRLGFFAPAIPTVQVPVNLTVISLTNTKTGSRIRKPKRKELSEEEKRPRTAFTSEQVGAIAPVNDNK